MSRNRRAIRIRKKLAQASDRPRLSVYRSNKHIYVQLIDDQTGKTLASANTKTIESKGTKTQKAVKVGEAIAKAAKNARVTKVKFDRGQYKYHGRVKAVSEAARDNGLEF